MSFWVAGATVVAGIGGSMISGNAAKKAQQGANNAQLQQARETNEANLRMFQESRGSTGHALLPEYFGTTEKSLGFDAANLAKMLMAYRGGPQGQLDDGIRTLARYQPSVEAGDQAVIDIFSGKTAEGRRASLAPVLAARTGLAKSRAAQINETLDATLAGLRTNRAKAGFRGGSTFDNNRLLAATTGARAAAATELGQANLDNARDVNALDDNNLELLMSSLDLPFSRAASVNAFNQMPMSNVSDAYMRAMAPLNFFKIGGGQLPYQSPTQLQSVMGSGQIAGAAISQGAQSIGNYFAQKRMADQMQQMLQQQQLTSYFNSPQFGGAISNGINSNLNTGIPMNTGGMYA